MLGAGEGVALHFSGICHLNFLAHGAWDKAITFSVEDQDRDAGPLHSPDRIRPIYVKVSVQPCTYRNKKLRHPSRKMHFFRNMADDFHWNCIGAIRNDSLYIFRQR